MRILKNNKKVFGFSELKKESQLKALKYFELRKNYENKKGNNYFYTVNDFEFYESGNVFFYTNNIDAY